MSRSRGGVEIPLHSRPPHAPLLLLLDLYPIALKKNSKKKINEGACCEESSLVMRSPLSTSSSQLVRFAYTTSICDQRLPSCFSCWLYSVGCLACSWVFVSGTGRFPSPAGGFLFPSAPVTLPAPVLPSVPRLWLPRCFLHSFIIMPCFLGNTTKLTDCISS